MQHIKPHLHLLLILFVSTVFGQFVGIAYIPVLPAIHHAFDVSTDIIQYSISFYLAGFAFTQIFSGFLSNHFGRRKIFLIGILITVIGAIICAEATRAVYVLSSFFLQACGVGCMVPITNTIVNDVFEEHIGGHIFTFINVAMAIGGICAPILGGVIEYYFGWRCVFVLLACIGLFIFLIAYFNLRETIKETVKHSFDFYHLKETATTLFSNKTFLRCALVSTFLIGAQNAFNTAAPFLLHHLLNLPIDRIAVLMLIPYASNIIGLIFASIFHKHISRENMILIGASIAVAIATIFLLSSLVTAFNLPFLMASISFVTFAIGIITPNYWTSALRSFLKIEAVAAAFMILCQNLYSVFVSAIIANLHERNAIPLAAVMFCTTVLGLLCFIRIKGRFN